MFREKVKVAICPQGGCCEAELAGVWSSDVSRIADGPARDAGLRSQLAVSGTSHGGTAEPTGNLQSFLSPVPRSPSSLTPKVYVPDARNHGDSPHTADMTFTHLSRDVVQFLKERKVEKTVLVGHSMGGTTAMFTALKYVVRERVCVCTCWLQVSTTGGGSGGAGLLTREPPQSAQSSG